MRARAGALEQDGLVDALRNVAFPLAEPKQAKAWVAGDAAY
jgi:hypothetical protein